jgi:membrane carboxypeptidase/penicillin-binding protein
VGAAPIFHGFMTAALNGQPDAWYGVPAGLHAINLDGYVAYLLPGTENVASSQQPTLPPTRCEEDCGGGDNNKGGGDSGHGHHKKHG